MNIQLRPEKLHYLSSIFASFLKIVLICLSLPQQVAAAFPFKAYQFQTSFSPAVTSGISPKTYSIALPTSYSTATYTRYVALSGYSAQLQSSVNFKVYLSSGTNSAQNVVISVDPSMNMLLLQIQIIFISTNTWIWASNQTYSCSAINYYTWWGSSSQNTFLPVLTPVANTNDFLVYPFVSWYNAQAQPWWGTSPPIAQILNAKLQSSTPPSIQVSFNRDSTNLQKFMNIGYVIIMVNQSELLVQNYPYNFYSLSSNTPFTTYPNLNIATTYKTSGASGSPAINGNCLIGLSTLKLSGNYGLKVTRGPTFNGAVYPFNNILNPLQSGDSFNANYNVMCFTGVTCPATKYYNPTTSVCGPCTITNCTTCLTYAICKTCATQSAVNASVCAYCPLLSPGCLTCTNSTYCMTCINSSYVLNQSLCALCSVFITGCYNCSSKTHCLSCLSVGYYTNITSCVLCSTTMPFCLICTNDTVCLNCSASYYFQSGTDVCAPCNTTLPQCDDCNNDTVCLGCVANYFLAANGSCQACSYYISHCLTCTDTHTCTSCITGFYVQSGSCVACSSAPTLSNCLACPSSTVCTLCNVSYYLQTSNNTCSPCSLLANCVVCTNSYTCIECQVNYLVSGTVCLPCLSALPNCQTCDNSTYCTSCVSDAFYLSQTLAICLPCGVAITNCATCLEPNASSTSLGPAPSSVSMTCLSCNSPMVVSPSNICVDCQVAIPNCGDCVNYTFCSSCVNDSYVYFVSNNTCTPCSDLFRNCSQCTQQICSSCEDGFGLSTNAKMCNCLVGKYTNGVCSSIPGCVQPFQYPNKKVGCLACEPVDFFVTPVYDHCQCRHGTLIGDICSDIKNCIAALIGLDGQVYCAFCNITAGYKHTPVNKTNCVCNDHYVDNGTFCLDQCGDGYLLNTTKGNCDDGNLEDGDGCSSICRVENFYRCQNGSDQSPSQCYYIGSQIKVALSQIYKNQDQNQGIFEFSVSPALKAFSKMNYSNYLTLDCNSTYVTTQMSYSDGIITVKADYTRDMEGVECHFVLDFNRSLVRSPQAKLSFNAVSSTYPLIISNYLSQLKSFKVSFTTLSYIIMGVFGLSLTHKLIGAELLICTQIVYLSNCFYQVPSVYLNPLQNLNLVTGDWSYFYQNSTQNMFAPFSKRVQMSVYFLQNTLFVTSSLLIITTIIIVLVVILKIKSEPPRTSQGQKISHNSTILNPGWPFNLLKLFYRSFAFPAVAAFFLVIFISGYIQNFNFCGTLQGKFTLILNGIAQFFAWTALALVLGFEVFGSFILQSQGIAKLVSEEYAKKWYINWFIFRLIIITVVIQLGINFTYSKLLFVLALVQLVYLLISIVIRVYERALDNIGVICCVFTQCYALALPVICRFYTIPQSLFVVLVYGMLGLLVCSIFFAALRTFYVMKENIIRCKDALTKKLRKTKKKRQLAKELLSKDEYVKKRNNLSIRDDIDNIQQPKNIFINEFLDKELNMKQEKQEQKDAHHNLQNSSIYRNVHEEQQKGLGNQDMSFKKTMKRLREDFRSKIGITRKKISRSSAK